MRINDQTPLAKRSVLCVQPKEDFHPSIELALSKYRVVIVHNAMDAIRAMNDGHFDAYVLDYWLPDWNGPALCREIRQQDPHVPICFFTGAEGQDLKKRALRAGAQGFLSAPDEAWVLAEKLRNWLQYADLAALRAKIDEEHAIQHELERRATVAIAASEHARERAREAMERVVQLRARKAFIDAGGTLATFQRWWPQIRASAVANRPAEAQRGT